MGIGDDAVGSEGLGMVSAAGSIEPAQDDFGLRLDSAKDLDDFLDSGVPVGQ